VVVDRRDVVRQAELDDGLVLDLVHLVGELEPRRRAREEQVRHERQERQQQQRRRVAPVQLPAPQPEEEAGGDRQHEVHEVEVHGGQVEPADDLRPVQRVLEHDRRHAAAEQRALHHREVVGREAGLGGEAAHDLVSEEQEKEWEKVEDELPPAAERHGDDQQGQRDPLRLDLDAAPEHDPEDQSEIEDAAGDQQPAPPGRRRGARPRVESRHSVGV